MPIKKDTTNVEDNYVYTAKVNEINIGDTMYYKKENKIPTTSVSLNKTSIILQLGEQETLTATVTPSNTTDELIWSQSNPTVTSLYSSSAMSRVVRGLSIGTSVIFANSGSYSARVYATVTPIITAMSFTNTTDSTVTLYQKMGNMDLSYSTTINQTWGYRSSSFKYSTDGSTWMSGSATNTFTLQNGVYTCTGPAVILTIPARETVYIKEFNAIPFAASGKYVSPRGAIRYYGNRSYKTIYASGSVYVRGKMSYFVQNSTYVYALKSIFQENITQDIQNDVTTTTRSIVMDNNDITLSGVI